ncbi:MAG TPA: ABC transporter substrate-binding protein [Rhizobiaceae bacterium]|nr:ABC transporter substrate-binding protein [Rhizobiaceae bacterium]
MIGHIQRRHFLGLVTGALTAALIKTSTYAAEKPEVDTLSISIGPDLPFLVHIVAKQKGWFADAGFKNVAFKQFTSGNLAGEALLADQIQLWTPGNLPPVAMVHNGIPIVILGSNAVSHGLEKLVVRKDAKIEKPEDLYRIKIGLLVSSTSGAMLGNLARKYGLDPAKLRPVNLAPPEGVAALKKNEVQGIIYWEPFPYEALQNPEMELLHTGTRSYFPQNKGKEVQISNNRTVWVASQDWVKRNPVATRGLVGVLLKAQAWVSDPAHQQEALKIFSDYEKQPIAMNKAIISNYAFDPKFDQGYVDDMKAMEAFLKSTNRIPSEGDPLDYSYSDPMKSIDPSLVEIDGKWKP